MITPTDIEKLAQLCRLAITKEEKERLTSEIETILAYVSEVQSVAGKLEPTPGRVHNILREDGAPHESGIYTEALLAQAPRREDGYIAVKRILS